MPLVSMRQILDHAAENNYGVPAFNINDMEQIIAVLEAAKEVNAPVITPDVYRGEKNLPATR